jgi:cyclophilin family peptidyl-prolyl cis-trans isomerase
VTLTLDAEKAPETVRNFLGYVNEGFYDQTIVHQVFRGNSVLAGGYDVNLVEKTPRAPIPNEAHNGLKNVRGTIAMTRFPDDVHSATCQFFLNVADNPSLDFRDQTLDGYGYCVFGRVTDGMDVVDQMAMSEVRELPDFDQMPAPTITIMSARQVP